MIDFHKKLEELREKNREKKRLATYGDIERNPNVPGLLTPALPARPFPDLDAMRRLAEPKYEFLTGNAGTGKTFTLKERLAKDSEYGLICASTGVAACNIDAVTIHSTFKFYNQKDLTRKFENGKLRRKISELYDEGLLGRHIILDEVSMFNAACLDMVFDSVDRGTYGKVGFVVTGDFAQLPPVEGEFAFKADCWPEFEKNTTRLTKVWRQDDPAFLEALNAMRSGRQEAAGLLRDAGANFSFYLDPEFKGVTLMPTNNQANALNDSRYESLEGPEFMFTKSTTGACAEEWDDIPDTVRVKRGMRCMLTANDTPGFAWANGDMGEVVFVDEKVPGRPAYVIVRLDRTGDDVTVGYMTRRHFDHGGLQARMLGSVTFLPLKLAYALTVHKCQGLTLGAIQFDVGHTFAGSPSLAYVACSRVRRARDIKIVGAVDTLAKRIKCHQEVTKWL